MKCFWLPVRISSYNKPKGCCSLMAWASIMSANKHYIHIFSHACTPCPYTLLIYKCRHVNMYLDRQNMLVWTWNICFYVHQDRDYLHKRAFINPFKTTSGGLRDNLAQTAPNYYSITYGLRLPNPDSLKGQVKNIFFYISKCETAQKVGGTQRLSSQRWALKLNK